MHSAGSSAAAYAVQAAAVMVIPGRASEKQKAFIQLSALKKIRRKNGWTIFSCTITYLKADALVPLQHAFRMLE
ncbi:hypothetical protein EGI99_02480 [Stutzerimonas stutzeri]|nr:hypothetical protein EGI99_02480 [Stutzerimonas stutzeri]